VTRTAQFLITATLIASLALVASPAGTAPVLGASAKAGPALLLKSGTVDMPAQTVTLPLRRGRMRDGRRVWFIVTDASDPAVAAGQGVNHAAKLVNALAGKGPRVATRESDGTLTFERGTVDFAPVRAVAPGPKAVPFPPRAADPGSVGDQDYTPLLRIQNGGSVVYNAPIVAFGVDEPQINFCDGKPDHNLVHDRVVKICPQRNTVTLALTRGFSTGRPVLYISTDASDRGVAAMEAATFAPRLSEAAPAGGYGEHSQVEALLAVTNGPTGASNPARQGLASALADGGGPLNIVGAIPTLGEGYSPLWSVNLGEWTRAAISQGRRTRVTDLAKAMEFTRRKWITGPGGKAFGPSGIVVDCPVVQRVE
jgi:hypothetical protein